MDTEKEFLQKGLNHHSCGEFNSAEKIYREILRDNPNHGDANNLLGTLLFQKGQYDMAIEFIQKAASNYPDRFAYHQNLGAVYEKLGRLQEAVSCNRTGLSIDKNNPQILYNLANCLQKLSETDEAIELYNKVIQLSPGNINSYMQIASCYASKDEYTQSILIMQKAYSLDPDNKDVIYALASLFNHIGNYKEASKYFQKFVAKYPEQSEVIILLANCYQNLGELDRAVELYKEVLKKDPYSALACYNLGLAYHKKNQFENAKIILKKALEKSPIAYGKDDHLKSKILSTLGTCLMAQGKTSEAQEKFQESLKINSGDIDNLLAMLDFLEKTSKLDEAQKYVDKLFKISPENLRVNIVCASVLRRTGKTQEALKKLTRLETPQYDYENAARLHYELGHLYDLTSDFQKAYINFQKANQFKSSSCDKIRVDKNSFLNNLDRIRKTFSLDNLEAIFHETISFDGDSPVFLVGFPRSGTTLIDQILDSNPKLQVMEEEPALTHTINDIDRLFFESSRYPETILAYKSQHIVEFRKKYFQNVKLSIQREKNTTLIDKFPLHIVHLGVINKVFPESKIILVIRHPYDVCLSNFMQDYMLNDAMANFTTLKNAAILYDRVMSIWCHYEHNLRINYHIIRYEDLVDNFEEERQLLFNFLGLEMLDNSVKFYEHARNKKLIRTPSYQQVTQPLYTKAKYRWKSYSKYFDPFKEILDKYVDHFGYEVL